MILAIFRILRKLRGTEDLSFTELRARCMQGDLPACQEFIARYEGLVVSSVTAQLPTASPQDIEEVVANTFTALLQDGARLLVRFDVNSLSSPASWIRHQAVLQARNRRRFLQTRKRGLETPLLLPTDADSDRRSPEERMPDPAPSAELQLMDAQERLDFRARFLKTLSPALALTFQYLYVDELEPADAARALGQSLESLYMRRHRIQEALQKFLRQEAGEVESESTSESNTSGQSASNPPRGLSS